jgi:cytochrome P450
VTAQPDVVPVLDPYSYDFHEDPYPTYAALREQTPLYRNDERGFWALTRHADVVAAFRDSDRFSSRDGVSIDPAGSGPDAYKTMSFLAMDEPRHGRMRKLVSAGFTPRRVAMLDERVREITVGHLLAVLDRGSFDFIEDIAGKVPMDVISELLGVPVADRGELRRLADLVIHREEGVLDVPPAAGEAALTLVQYYLDLVADRRRAPTDDLTSALLDVEIDGERLTDDEVVGVLFLMVVAGNETTTKLLGHAWYWAWRNPDQRAKPFTDPARVTDWVEETLRYDASTQILARTAATDIPMYDATMRAGDRVLLLLGAANRDPRAFSEPDRYDLDRDTSALISFGSGRHFCLGASLARLEARIVLDELVRLVADYDIDSANARRSHSVNVRGFEVLPTKVQMR